MPTWRHRGVRSCLGFLGSPRSWPSSVERGCGRAVPPCLSDRPPGCDNIAPAWWRHARSGRSRVRRTAWSYRTSRTACWRRVSSPGIWCGCHRCSTAGSTWTWSASHPTEGTGIKMSKRVGLVEYLPGGDCWKVVRWFRTNPSET